MTSRDGGIAALNGNVDENLTKGINLFQREGRITPVTETITPGDNTHHALARTLVGAGYTIYDNPRSWFKAPANDMSDAVSVQKSPTLLGSDPNSPAWRNMMEQGFNNTDFNQGLPDDNSPTSGGTQTVKGRENRGSPKTLQLTREDEENSKDETLPDRNDAPEPKAVAFTASDSGGGDSGGGGGGGVGGYNPDEPRDWHGRWTSGGGGDQGEQSAPPSESSPKAPSAPSPLPPENAPKEPPASPPVTPPPQAKYSIQELLKMAGDQGGWLSTGADQGSKECVPLVKAAVPELGPTREWKAGEPVGPDTKTGTPIGIGWDKDGNYPSNPSGNHVGIFDEWVGKTGEIKILDQNSGPVPNNMSRPERPADVRTVPSYKVPQYRVIRWK